MDCTLNARTIIEAASPSLSYLLSLAEIRQLARLFGNRTKPAPLLALRA